MRVSSPANQPEGTKRRTVYGKTQAEVRDKLAKAVADRADGIVFDDENMTVGEYLDGWLKCSVYGSVRDSTYDCYEIICRKHIGSVLGGKKLSKPTAMHVQRFYRDRLDTGLGPGHGTQVPHGTAQSPQAGRRVEPGAAQRRGRREGPATSPEKGDAGTLLRRGAPVAGCGARRPARSPLRAGRLHRDEGG